MWEPVLHHLIGTPEVMRDQLARLLELSQSVVIQVVPEESGRLASGCRSDSHHNLERIPSRREQAGQAVSVEEALLGQFDLVHAGPPSFRLGKCLPGSCEESPCRSP
jgi:hypothetical protein